MIWSYTSSNRSADLYRRIEGMDFLCRLQCLNNRMPFRPDVDFLCSIEDVTRLHSQ